VLGSETLSVIEILGFDGLNDFFTEENALRRYMIRGLTMGGVK
jgi:hypothetical protein